MFDIGMGEVLVLAVVALLVFGPDRLPVMAKQAASFVRDLRAMVANARRDLSDSVGDLGIDKDDLKTLSDMRNPKSFIRQKVLDGVDLGLDDLDVGLDDKPKRTASSTRKPVNGVAGARTNGSPSAAATGADTSADANGSAAPAAKASEVGTASASDTAVAPATGGGGGAGAVPASDSSTPRFDPDAT